MLLLALAAAAATPQPASPRTFADWAAGCDNGRACRAVALVPEAEDRDGYALLGIDRAAAGPAQPVLNYSIEAKTAGPLTLRLDGKPVAKTRPETPLPFNRALAAAFGNGRRASLTDAAGREVAHASLSGLAAAFLFMDDAQHRIGTAGALQRPGPQPDSTVPPPPALPRVERPAASSRPPRTLTPAAATRLIGPDNATCDYAIGPVHPESHRLDAAHTLVLVDHPCGNGAYNLFTSAFIVGEDGRVAPARFDVAAGMSEANDNQLVNADWSATTRTISSWAKGRGLGDCGISDEYAWDGALFRLIRQEVMGECRLTDTLIPTWRAELVPAR